MESKIKIDVNVPSANYVREEKKTSLLKGKRKMRRKLKLYAKKVTATY